MLIVSAKGERMQRVATADEPSTPNAKASVEGEAVCGSLQDLPDDGIHLFIHMTISNS